MEAYTPDPGPASGVAISAEKKNGFAWAKKLIKEAPKPKGFSVTAAKRAMQLVAGQGKEPAALKVEPDGSFTIELVQAGKVAAAPDENPLTRYFDMGKREVAFLHLHTYRDRHGKPRAYYKPSASKGIPLPLPVGSPEFLLAYAKAVEGEKLERAKAKTPNVKDTFRDLLRLYLKSALYSKLSPSSKRNYRAILEKFCQKYGHLPVSQFSRRHASNMLAKLSNTPEAANTLMKRLRLLLNFAVDIGMIPANPMVGMKGYKSEGEGYHDWTEEEIAQFIARHPLGTKAYLALMLMLSTGQRRSDAVRMGWGDVANGMIRVRQQKTGTPLMIPIIPALQAALADMPKGASTFLLTEYGRPYSAAGFGNWMRDRCDEAGLSNCSSHGLRKACARRLAEAGCTHHEIKAITGHKTDAEVRRYTDKADQVHLAHRALAKLQDTTKNPKSANPR